MTMMMIMKHRILKIIEKGKDLKINTRMTKNMIDIIKN